MLKMWINNNDNNEILKVGLIIMIVMRFLKVGLVIIIIGLWRFGLMIIIIIIIIIINRFWKLR